MQTFFYSCPHSCHSPDAGDSHGTPMPDGIQSNYNLKKKKVCYDFAMRGKEVWTRYGLSGHYDILVLLLFSHSVVDLLGIIVA